MSYVMRRQRHPTRPRQVPASEAEGLVDRAIAFWRGILSEPLAASFQTQDQIERQGARIATALQAVPAGKSDSGFLVMVPTLIVDLSEEGRRSVREKLMLEHYQTIRILTKPKATYVWLPVTYRISRPLSTIEIKQLETRQNELSEIIGRMEASPTVEVLKNLTRRGVDPFYLLSVMIRHARVRGTEVPLPPLIDFRDIEIESPIPRGKGWKQSPVLICLLRVSARLSIPTHRAVSRKRGPAEAAQSLGMALMARHHRMTAGRPHYREIAFLFQIWTPWLRDITADRVSRRISRVRSDSPAWARRGREEDRHAQAVGFTATKIPVASILAPILTRQPNVRVWQAASIISRRFS